MRALAELGAKIVGFTKSIRHGAGKPDGTPLKLLDVNKEKYRQYVLLISKKPSCFYYEI